MASEMVFFSPHNWRSYRYLMSARGMLLDLSSDVEWSIWEM